MHLLLLEGRTMLGVDLHDEVTLLPPPVPTELPAPIQPHVVAAPLEGWGPFGASIITGTETIADGVRIINRDSDIQGIIPHVPLDLPYFVLAPLYSFFAGSKSYFGPASVMAGKGPVACADTPAPINLNNQLNCNEWLALPTGLVEAQSTVVTDMTWGDVGAAFLGMGIDMLVTFAFGRLPSTKFGPTKDAEEVISKHVDVFVQQLTGSPLGYTAGSNYPGDTAKELSPGNWGREAENAVQGVPTVW